MTLQVDTVFVWVTDLERSLEWYWTIGLEPGPRFGPWQNMVVAGETRFALHEGSRADGPSTAVPSLRVEDLDSEIQRLGSHGIQPTDVEVTNTGVARFITFADPDGNEVQLLERQ